MLRTVQSLPPCRAFDTGLRPDPFPDRAASLLPGLLAATRTGLPPASDDELTTADQPPTRSTSCLLGARENLNRCYTRLITALRAPTERGNALLGRWRALDRVTVCPQRIGVIAAAALALTSLDRGTRWRVGSWRGGVDRR